MGRILNLNTKILRQINLWSWLASILPLTALAGLWFAWAFGSHSVLNIIMVIGGVSMFAVAVVWWWWAIHVMRYLLSHWENADVGIQGISQDIKEIRVLVEEVLPPPRDK